MNRLPLIVLLAAGATLGVTGCKTSAPKNNSDSVLNDTVVAEVQPGFSVDSIGYHMKRDSTMECTIGVDFPQGNDSLALVVKNFIAKELSAVYMPADLYSVDESYKSKYPQYKGSVTDGKQMLDFYGKGTMRYIEEELEDLRKYRDNDLPLLNQKVRIKMEENNAAFVTYSITDERYLGGAHGSYDFYYVNINKQTLKPMYQTVDTTRVKDMQPLLRKGVLQYLKECGEEDVTEATLKDNLFLPESGLIPLPVHTPWLQNDSLNFVYQQYEIASYAMGPIQFNIAYKDIMPYLTKETKALIEAKK